jgi:hypothetical protein
MNKKRLIFIIIASIVFILFGNSLPISLESYTQLPEEHKHLWTAIVVSIIGITIHLAKKKTQDKEMCMTGDLFEILMFMIIPATTSFEVFHDEIKQQPLIITGIFLSVLVIWLIIAMQLIHKEFQDKGQKILSLVKYFFGSMLHFDVGPIYSYFC